MKSIHEDPSLTRKPPFTWAGRRWDVFISYSWDDGSELAETLHKELTRIGLRVFLDRTNSESGERLSDWIKAQLRKSGVLVVLVTSAAQENVWVTQELDFFQERRAKAPVIPFFVEPCQPGGAGEGTLTKQMAKYVGITLRPKASPSNEDLTLVNSAVGRWKVKARRRLLLMLTVMTILGLTMAVMTVISVSIRQKRIALWSRVLESSKQEGQWRFAAKAAQELEQLDEPVTLVWRTALRKVLLVPSGKMELKEGEVVLDIVSAHDGPLVVALNESGEATGYLRNRRIDLGPWGEGTRVDGSDHLLLLEDEGRVLFLNLDSGEQVEQTVPGEIDDLQVVRGTPQLLLRKQEAAVRMSLSAKMPPESMILPVNFSEGEPRAKLEEVTFMGNREGEMMGLCRFGSSQTRFIVHKWSRNGEVRSPPWSHLTDDRSVPVMGDLRPSMHGQGFVFWYLVDQLPRPLALTPDLSLRSPNSRSFHRLIRYDDPPMQFSVSFDASEFEDVIALDGYQAIGAVRNDRGVVEWIGLPEATNEPPREFVTDGARVLAPWPDGPPAPAGLQGSGTPLLITAHEQDRSIRLWSRGGLLQKLYWPSDNSPYPPYPRLWAGKGPWVAVKVNRHLYFWSSSPSVEEFESETDFMHHLRLDMTPDGFLRDLFPIEFGTEAAATSSRNGP